MDDEARTLVGPDTDAALLGSNRTLEAFRLETSATSDVELGDAEPTRTVLLAENTSTRAMRELSLSIRRKVPRRGSAPHGHRASPVSSTRSTQAPAGTKMRAASGQEAASLAPASARRSFVR
ncbi:MAG: hypothetical protein OHK0013_38170 [Sandaracinaceae bacterium]